MTKNSTRYTCKLFSTDRYHYFSLYDGSSDIPIRNYKVAHSNKTGLKNIMRELKVKYNVICNTKAPQGYSARIKYLSSTKEYILKVIRNHDKKQVEHLRLKSTLNKRNLLIEVRRLEIKYCISFQQAA